MPQLPCSIRDFLARRCQVLLNEYARQLHQLGSQIGYEAAEPQLLALTKACVAARDALRHHEGEHACTWSDFGVVSTRSGGTFSLPSARSIPLISDNGAQI